MPYHETALKLRGDPGFFGSVFGGLKRIAGIAGGIVPGPVGAGLRLLGGGGRRGAQFRQVNIPPVQVGLPRGVSIGFPRGVSIGTRPGGLPVGAQTQAEGLVSQTGPQGYHLNKTGYYTQAGYVPPRSKWVKNRTRNPANGRALRRAVSRVQAFNNIVKRSRKSLRRLASI